MFVKMFVMNESVAVNGNPQITVYRTRNICDSQTS